MRAVLLTLAMACVAAAPPAPPLNLSHETSFTVYQADLNHMGTLAGGKTLTEMDRVAGMTARRLLYASAVRDAVTVGADKVRFLTPGRSGDLIVVKGEVVALGTKSITVRVTLRKEHPSYGGRSPGLPVADAVFTFVAFDRSKNRAGEAAEHGLKLEGK
jgi:acyl-CoA hydrolase